MPGLSFCGIISSRWVTIALFLLLISTLRAQPAWIWAEGVQAGSEQRGDAIAADENGNTFSTGYFKGNVVFGSTTLSNAGGEDIYVVKYDGSGNAVWATSIAGTGAEYGHGIAIDAAGNVYVCGEINNTVTCEGSPNINVPTYGNRDIFIAKYSSSGGVLWAKHAGSTNNDEAYAVCTDGTNVYVTGFFEGTATFGALPQLTSAGGQDVFVAAYDCGTGTEQWAVKGGSTANDNGEGIAVDASGVYVSGYYGNATCTFQNHSGSLAANGGTDMFLVKYDLSGTTGLWKRRAGGTNTDEGTSVALNGSFVYVGGFFQNTINFYNNGPVVASQATAGAHDSFIAQYDAGTGNFSWVRSESGTGDDRIFGVAAGPNGIVYTTGYWNGTLPFGSGPSVTSGNRDVFATAYSSAGTFLFGMRATGSSEEEGNGVAANANNEVFVTGFYKSSNTQFGTTPQLSNSAEDIFIAKFLCGVTAATAGTDQTICAPSCTMSGNTPAAGTGTWTLISGSGIITNPNLSTTTVTGLSTGTNVFRWTISNGGCESYDEVTITRDAVPSTALAGFDQTVCSTSVFLNAVNPSTGNGLWTLISGSGTIVNPTNDNTNVNALGVGANVFQWTVSNGVCPSSSDQVTITVDAAPTPSSAGADQTVCGDSSAMNGNTPLVGSGTWSVLNGSGTFSNAGSPASAVSNLDPGQNTFVWRISNGTCPASRDTVEIWSDEMPSAASAGNDQTLCSTNAYINAINPQTGAGMWTLISGTGSIVNPNSDNTWVNSLGAGANVFQWTVSNGVCPSSSDSVTITVDEMPTQANAGTDAILCTSSHQLNGNTPLVGTGTWSVALGGGTFTNASLPTTLVNSLPVGVNVFQWTISNGVCPSSSDNVLVTIDLSPTAADAGADRALCSTDDTLTGNFPLTGTGVWSLLSGSGTIQSPSAATSPVTALGIGPNEFTWTISNGVCPPSVDTIVITRDDLPSAALAGPDVNSCAPADTLSAGIPQTGTGSWSVISGNSVLDDSASASSAISNLSVGQNILVWTVSNGSCPSTQDTVIITYNELPSLPDAGNDITACGEQVLMQAQVPLTGSGVWSAVQGAPISGDTTDPAMVLPPLSAGTWYYTWTTQNGFCISAPDTIAITVFALPSSAIAGDDRVTYVRWVRLDATPLDTGIGTWTFVQGSGTFENIHDPFTRVYDLPEGINILRWTASNGTCPENADELRIQVMPLIVPEGFSPNGDGVNDNFEITGLDEFQNPSLEIFNRWGNQVYVSGSYLNNWNGTAQNGDPLPDDVYYYVLKPDAENVFTGFIIIKRNTP